MRRSTYALALLPLLPGVSVAQTPHPLAEVGEATYVFVLAEEPIGREQVEFRADGWSTTGHYEVRGQRVEYSARWTRAGADSGEWFSAGEGGRSPGQVRCEWLGDSIEVHAIEDGGEPLVTHVGWERDTAPVFFENIVWAVCAEIGVRLFEAGEEPRVSASVPLFRPQTASVLDARVKSLARRTWRAQPDGDSLELYDLRIVMGEAEMSMTFTRAGLLVHLAVPSQQIEVLHADFEDVAPVAAPRTLVDAGPWRKSLSRPAYEFTKSTGLLAEMRDGVRLAADVYLPVGDGPWPTVLSRTPYGRASAGAANGSFYARRGYAFVTQDVRGCFDSEGEWFPVVHERDDGSDTLDWIAAQEWSNGRVGMIGGSYGGWVQLLAAVSGNPHLDAIVPQVAPPDPLDAFPYEGGAFQLGVAWWALILDHLAGGGGGPLPDLEWTEVFATWPLSRLDEVLGVEHPFLDEWLAHPPSDADYWEPLSYQQHLAEMDVAALHVTGWYDGDLHGALENFPVLRSQAKSERAREGQFLIVGPWGHAFNQSRRIGAVDFGPTALVDLKAVYVRFFDRYLKDADNGIEDEHPVSVFVMGANEWRRAVSWPLPDTVFTELFLASDGNARSRDGDGRLELEPTGSAAADTFSYDPSAPPPTPEVTFGDQLKNSRLMDLSATADREDVLDYTTPPFPTPVEVTGPVELVVWIETDAADTDVCTKLVRIEPDGTARRITGGIQRVRYRLGPGTDEPVEPGTPVEVRVALRATGLRVEAGERLRLELCSSEFPSFALHPNTLDPAATASEPVVATTRVLHDDAHPSRLVLPVIVRE